MSSMGFETGSRLGALLLGMLLVSPSCQADADGTGPADAAPASQAQGAHPHRLIVELNDPPLAAYRGGVAGIAAPTRAKVNGRERLSLDGSAERAYLAHLDRAQQDFVAALSKALPAAAPASLVDAKGLAANASYRVVFNGMAVDTGTLPLQQARKRLLAIPGVRAVHFDRPHYPTLHTSLNLIGAPVAWAEAGGRSDAGSGIKLASMDGGVHRDAPMFDGTGFSYPAGFPLGDTQNTNGKIIVSRAYFRGDDPPQAGDGETWPGLGGTSHGVHTAGIAIGNAVPGTYLGSSLGTLSGVAPGAWVMNYRVFYPSVGGSGSFFNAEGIAALEDIVRDGADVVNNSWGAGPGSIGGQFDPLDTALINAANAGVFVVMSNGNAGPFEGTGDHPSDDYINVAATTSGGSYDNGRLSASAPQPVPAGLQAMAFAYSSMGASIAPGAVENFALVASAALPGDNITGCAAWPADTFLGKAALVERGDCEFGVKVLNAQTAGADFVIVYNTAAGGEALTTMGPGLVGHQVTIPSVFVGRTGGVGLVEWYSTHGNAAQIELNNQGFFATGTADVVADFSSRGPSAAGTLKPDIAAPGVSVMSHGYTTGAFGEARHLGFGQVSGTSMAAPHVAGAAAVLRQLRPTWSNAAIKSALMSTSKYLDVFTASGAPAQPLDIGAGRLDLAAALDPGVILDPPGLSFGYVEQAGSRSIEVRVTNIAAAAETFTANTLRTADGFGAPGTMPGLTVEPTQFTLQPGAFATVTVSFDAGTGTGLGDNQGFVVLQGDNGHDAHLPAWARVMQSAQATADVLLIHNDLHAIATLPDYLSYYTGALTALGVSFDVFDDADWLAAPGQVIPHPSVLSSYEAVIWFTGDNFSPDGSFNAKTPLAWQDMDRLVEYANSGGAVIVTGQDASSVMDAHFLMSDLFHIDSVLADGVEVDQLPSQTIAPPPGAPPAFADLALDLSGSTGTGISGAGNQRFVDALGTQAPAFLLYPPGAAVDSPATVAVLRRDQPSLESPGIAFLGKMALLGFGLEGVNDGIAGRTTRAALLGRLLDWAADAPTVTADATLGARVSARQQVAFDATFGSNIAGTRATAYRWDFGDGSPFTTASGSAAATHGYNACDTYTARVESTDSWGNVAIDTVEVVIDQDCDQLGGLFGDGFEGGALAR